MTHPDDEILGKAYDARLMKRLLTYVRPYTRLVLLSTLALLGFSCLDLVLPLLVKQAIDGPIIGRLEKTVTPDDAFDQMLNIGLLYGVIVIVAFGLRMAQMRAVEYLGQRIMVDLRRELFGKIQRLSMRFFHHYPVGTLVTRVVSDVEALYQVLSTGIVSIFGDLVKIVAIVGIMLWMNAGLALWLFSVIPVLFVVSLQFRRRARDSYREVRKQVSRTNAWLQESITGVEVIQIFGQEAKAERRFADRNEALFGAHIRTIFNYAWFFPVVEFLFAVAQALLIWVGAQHIAGGGLTAGDFFLFWLYIHLVFEPIRDLSEQYNVMQAAMASSERIFTILDTEEAVPNPALPTLIEGEPEGEIRFDKVWFAYEAENWVLKDLSFRVAPGESVALVGATGAGKTSIISLISRLYDVNRGAILLDGHDLREYDKYELRSHISVVLQDVFLFAGDIMENIRLGHDEIPEERVIEAAKAVNADAFIRRLDGGYRAEVLERGATLSTGQKQLLAFARALAFDPRVLILDEATSSVDTETEIMIQSALETLMKGRTSLIIAHRLSTIQRCDRILVLHHGELKEQGTHTELLARRGIYRRLYDLQYGRA